VLEALLHVKTGGSAQNQMPFLKVAVAGSKPGIGVTHVSLSVPRYRQYGDWHLLRLQKGIGPPLGTKWDKIGLSTDPDS